MNEAEIASLRAALAEAERESEMWERRQDATQGDLEQTGKMLAKAEDDLAVMREALKAIVTLIEGMNEDE